MMDASKYSIGYYAPPVNEYRWVKKDHIEKAPIWCSVDLRDGNQSLVIPMSLSENLSFINCCWKLVLKKLKLGFQLPVKPNMNFTNDH